MLGAIAGDVIGSVYERHVHKSTDFPLFAQRCRFTDDTVLTVATAHAILTGTPYGDAYHAYGNRYPRAGYGRAFKGWLASPTPEPYDSWGNGSAMRVSPVGIAALSADDAMLEAERSAMPTHNHAEGIRGAQAVALAVFLARAGVSKSVIRQEVSTQLGYDLSRSLADIRPAYHFEVSCQGSVPEALIAFFEAESVEDAIRLAISLGGDADTQAAIAGSVAEAFWGEVPAAIVSETRRKLPDEFLVTIDEFNRKYPPKASART